MTEQHYTTQELAEILDITVQQVVAVAKKLGIRPEYYGSRRELYRWHVDTLPAFVNRPKRGRPKGVKS